MKVRCDSLSGVQLFGKTLQRDRRLLYKKVGGQDMPLSHTATALSANETPDHSSTVTDRGRANDRRVFSEDGNEVWIKHSFQNHVMPSFYRGKSTVIAADPETHVQLQTNKQQRQMGYGKQSRDKTNLNPLDVRSLCHRNDELEVIRKNQPVYCREQEHLPPVKSRPVALVSQKHSGNAPGTSVTLPTVLQLQGILQITSSSPATTCSSGVSSMTGSSGQVSRRHHIETFLTNHTTQHRTSNHLQSSFTLQATSCFNPTLHRYSSIYTSIDSSLNGSQPKPDSQMSAALPTTWYDYHPHPQLQPSPASTDSGLSSPQQTKTIVVKLPSIHCTPATPLTSQHVDSMIAHNNSQKQLQKSLKQGELRQKELCNLFTDIKELNSWNKELLDR